MADLGEFGRPRVIEHSDDKPDTFTFYGERFTLQRAISIAVVMDFVADQQAATDDRLAAKETGDDVGVVAATNRLLICMREFCRACLGPEWPRFNRVVRAEAVDGDELMEVCGRIYSAVANRPTSRPSESSDGPSSTGTTSTAGSGSPEVTPGLTASEEPLLGEVIELTHETAAQRQAREFREQMRPAGELLGLTRSSG